MNIGKSLKEHRENAKLTQTELANKTGIKQQNISRWEKNINIPNVMECVKLASFYQISIDFLIGYENEDGTKNFFNINDSFNNNNGSINFKM